MARPIKETPILRGADSIRFSTMQKIAESEPIDPETLARIKRNYARLKAILK